MLVYQRIPWSWTQQEHLEEAKALNQQRVLEDGGRGSDSYDVKQLSSWQRWVQTEVNTYGGCVKIGYPKIRW